MKIEKQSTSLFYKFTIVATIVGFVVNIFTIISILLALQIPDVDITLYLSDLTISTWHVLALWSIAVFVYMGFLNEYWSRKKLDESLGKNFKDFLVKLLSFKKPVLLLPLFLLGLLFIGIVGMIGTIIVLILLITAGFVYSMQNAFADLGEDHRSIESNIKAKNLVDENWTLVNKKIKEELKLKPWIDVNSFEDFSNYWDVRVESLEYALTKYAIENPGIVAYARVLSKDKMNAITKSKVLVSIKSLDESQFILQ